MPGPIVALVTLTVFAWFLKLPVETIGTRFGGIPQGLPSFALPAFSWETVKLLVTPTLTIALLGAIESLLCARVADQLGTQPRHDPNQELMAQGVANFITPFFGGMPATGTIARTVTNVRAGATSPVAGMVHALTLLLVVLLAAPLALHVPLAVLAGILLFVAWNMGEWHAFARMRQYSSHYRVLMLGTFFLTVVFDLTVAVQVGLVLACALFIRRMSSLFRVELTSQHRQCQRQPAHLQAVRRAVLWRRGQDRCGRAGGGKRATRAAGGAGRAAAGVAGRVGPGRPAPAAQGRAGARRHAARGFTAGAAASAV
jgi:SulP family sulfate permease